MGIPLKETGAASPGLATHDEGPGKPDDHVRTAACSPIGGPEKFASRLYFSHPLLCRPLGGSPVAALFDFVHLFFCLFSGQQSIIGFPHLPFEILSFPQMLALYSKQYSLGKSISELTACLWLSSETNTQELERHLRI